jgi:hypothetical protein
MPLKDALPPDAAGGRSVMDTPLKEALLRGPRGRGASVDDISRSSGSGSDALGAKADSGAAAAAAGGAACWSSSPLGCSSNGCLGMELCGCTAFWAAKVAP